MPLELQDVPDWQPGLSCVLTALSALSGETPTQVHAKLRVIASQDGRNIGPELRADYNINDWLAAVEQLGGRWRQRLDYRNLPFEQRPTINDFMRNDPNTDTELVHCDDGGTGLPTHVFAREARDVVDAYTDGRRAQFTGVTEDYLPFRVKLTFLVNP
jgi:hypothetical protein